MSSMSKRALARTERELQELLSLPGNSVCADCSNRNPAWASWNIGIFLCMRCATLHRKLGTHISKVKSLTMDSWTNEQVENMRKNGNAAVNKMYNPKNRQPDIPLDADEVDNAMERFIRKKYQEKSLSDGKPEVPRRDEPTPVVSRSPETSPIPVQPPKKKGFWGGLGLRSSSSAYPLSKHDKKHRNEVKVDNGFRVSSEDYSTRPKINSRSTSRREMSEHELEAKLAQLRDMGFTDTERNTGMLRKTRGDIEMVIAALVKQGSRSAGAGTTNTNTDALKGGATRSSDVQSSAQQSYSTNTGPSNNPFDALNRTQQAGLGLSDGAHQAPSPSTNPWQTAMSVQPNTGLEQPFSGMQIHPQPLFPHSTGGYATQQDPRFHQSMTPPIPSLPQAYSATTSPISTNNPFMHQQQTPLSAHSTGSNPYAAHMQGMPAFAPSTNPFMNSNSSTPSQTTTSVLSNPFGLPPSQNEGQAYSQPHGGQVNTQSFQNQLYPQSQTTTHASSSPGFPGHQFSQPQGQQHQYQQQEQQVQSQPQPQIQQIQNMQGNHFANHHQQQQASLLPQQTGRYDKNSILALYNYPHFAPQNALAPIPEPAEAGQTASAQPISPAPSDVYAQSPNLLNSAKRASTMPVFSPTSSYQTQQELSRNPFMVQNNDSGTFSSTALNRQVQSQPQSPNSALPQFSSFGIANPYMAQTIQPSPSASASASTTIMAPSATMATRNPYANSTNINGIRHTSAESMSVSNPNLLDGRHSPDAWGGLSARYVR